MLDKGTFCLILFYITKTMTLAVCSTTLTYLNNTSYELSVFLQNKFTLKSMFSTIWLLRMQRKEHAYTQPIRKQPSYLQKMLKSNVYQCFVPLLFERAISCQSFRFFFNCCSKHSFCAITNHSSQRLTQLYQYYLALPLFLIMVKWKLNQHWISRSFIEFDKN